MHNFYLRFKQKTTQKLSKRLKIPELETGFSMLEAVVVVGVLLALVAGGFLAYGPITENAKIAKVKSTAAEVYTSAMAFHFDGDATTAPQDAIDNWNGSTDKIRVELVAPAPADPLVGAMSTGGIFPTAYEPIPGEDFCVSATNVENPHIHAGFGSCPATISSGTENDSGTDAGADDGSADGTGDGTNTGGTGDGSTGAGDGSTTTPTVGSPGDKSHLPPSNTTEGYLVLKFDTSAETQCSTITLPIEYIGYSANSVNWGDGTITPTPAWNTEHTYAEQGVRYIVIKGQVGAFGNENWEDAGCLLEVPMWTNATGTKDLAYAFNNTTRLASVSSIPQTVTTLEGAFKNSTFNNTLPWGNLPKLITTFEMFKNNKNFNQQVVFLPEALQITASMFEGATAMNSDVNLAGTNRGQTLNNISSMFKDATSFNSNVYLGYADAVVSAQSMFENATSFNKPLSLSLAFTNGADRMFKNATSFNQPVSSMKFGYAASYREMFMGATSFNQPVSSFTMKAGESHILISMFEGATSFNQPLYGWDISNVRALSRMFWNTPSFTQDLSAMQIHYTLSGTSNDFSDAPDRSWWPAYLSAAS